MDGLDCLLCRIRLSADYDFSYEVLDFRTYPYQEQTRKMIGRALTGEHQRVRAAHKQLGAVFSKCAKQFLHGRSVDLAGSHGQTVAHQDGVSTLQIGDVKPLAGLLEVPVVYDFRTADIRAGGNGAPLVPYLDWLLYRNLPVHTLTLNLGGIANLTHIQPHCRRSAVSGFDSGPGMALIDEAAKYFYGADCDRDGIFSINGSIDKKLLSRLMCHPFVSKRPPKSTGRHEFGPVYLQELLKLFPDIPGENFMRTLVAFTAKSISANITNHLKFPRDNSRLVLAGGGVKHPVLLQDLRNTLPIESIVYSGDSDPGGDLKEALLVAALAVSKIERLPANMVEVTGAGFETELGSIIRLHGQEC